MGIPVIATPLSLDGIDIVHGETALAAELEQMAARTIALLKDDQLRQTLSKRGPELIQSRYRWAHVADSYEQLYAEICAG